MDANPEDALLIDLEAVEERDNVISHGLESCEKGIDQEAFVLSVQAGAPDVLPE